MCISVKMAKWAFWRKFSLPDFQAIIQSVRVVALSLLRSSPFFSGERLRLIETAFLAIIPSFYRVISVFYLSFFVKKKDFLTNILRFSIYESLFSTSSNLYRFRTQKTRARARAIPTTKCWFVPSTSRSAPEASRYASFSKVRTRPT